MSEDSTRRATIAGLLAASGVGLVGAALDRSRWSEVDPGASGVVVLSGDGIDPSGMRDSSAAVQLVLDRLPVGATVVNPSGAILRIERGLAVRQERTRLTGSGEWRFASGGSYGVGPEDQQGFIDVRADHCRIDGIVATNPDGVRNRGITVLADHVSVIDCTLQGFGQGITVAPSGEFHSARISGNHVIDVLGDGRGSADTSDVGESYGDGIVSWGAETVITDNLVSCREGSDARIGIHVEALTDQEQRPWTHDHRLASISGNIVTGRFRRGIVSEGVHHVVITGNAVADATWWSIALISADHCVVSANTIRVTRTAQDTQGSWWGPTRAGITLYGVADGQPVRDAVIVDNAVDVPSGSEIVAGVVVLANGAGAGVVGGRIAGNRVQAEGALQFGLLARAATVDLEVTGNRISGASSTGIALRQAEGPSVRMNSVLGGDVGVSVSGGADAVCEQNRTRGARIGIRLDGVTGDTLVRGNLLQQASVAIAMSESQASGAADGNVIW